MTMTLKEKILLKFSKDPMDTQSHAAPKEWDVVTALTILEEVFPRFKDTIKDKAIVDFGSGLGYQSVAMIKSGAKRILGLDINPKSLQKARDLARAHGLNGQCQFKNAFDVEDRGAFDIVISQNSMEHFNDPEGIINLMKDALNETGVIYITFGPPWYAPHGSHMQFFTSIPWVNILFDERTVMNVRSRFRDDGARRYEEVESGLNKMTVKKFEKIIDSCGMKIDYKRYDCVKNLNLFGKLPGVRELFINHITCILSKKETT